MSVTVGADNSAYVYDISGTIHEIGGWSGTTVALSSSCVVSIKAVNNDGPMGLIAETDSGVITDNTWRCTTTEHADWFTETFNDGSWPSAHAWYDYAGGPWGSLPNIDANSKWIWTDNQNDLTIFCRKQICPGMKCLP